MHKFYFRTLFAALAVMAGCLGVTADTGASDTQISYTPTILIVESDAEAAELESQGVIIWHRRADMALAAVPDNIAEGLSRVNAKIKKPNLKPIKAVPTMDVAKTHFGADRILNGSSELPPFTGKGVVAGFCDIGFDPNHINFKDKDGNSRVKRLIYYDEPNGIRKVMDSAEEIAEWTTDDAGNTHGTHVAGILAGSYTANGYSGMAPEADIVAATCQLYDAGILAAIEDIIDYAKSVKKPAVINLSIGSYNGPHDGSSLFGRYLDLLGEEAIICAAAGNEGASDNSYRITFSEKTPSWRVRMQSTDWISYDMYGLTDAWSADERPFKMKFHIYDEVEKTSRFESEWMTEETAYPYIISADNYPEFADFMTGMIYVDAGIDERSGRWYFEALYQTHTDYSNPTSGTWAGYNLAFEFAGDEGVHADVTVDSQYSKIVQWPGYAAPNSDLSVSDLATGNNVICVGMYNNRAQLPLLDGSTVNTGFEPLTVNKMSGYGTLADGRVLPHTVAPGVKVISSTSSHFLANNPTQTWYDLNAKAEVDGKTYYWHTDGGTSMSTPYLAGVMATWLEAYPAMSIADAKKFIALTNTTDYATRATPDPRSGNGWFHPYEGLKTLVSITGIDGIGKVESGAPAVSLRGDVAEILNPCSERLSISIYSINGVKAIPTVSTVDSITTIDLSALERGSYVLCIDSDMKSPVRRKFMR